MRLGLTKAAVLIALLPAFAFNVLVYAQRGGRGGPAAPPTPRAAAPFDLTGQWVSLITEDWRHRQFMPAKGDYAPLPLSPAARKIADSWDPAKDEAASEQCKAYGAAGVLRLPTRMRLAWQDDSTLKLETDAGTQTRIFYFGAPQGNGGGPPSGSLKVVTTRMRPGYLRKNGVPYGTNAVLTEYFDRFDVPGGDSLIIVTSELVDSENLMTPYWTSQQFKRENGTTGWNPTPCAAR